MGHLGIAVLEAAVGSGVAEVERRSSVRRIVCGGAREEAGAGAHGPTGGGGALPDLPGARPRASRTCRCACSPAAVTRELDGLGVDADALRLLAHRLPQPPGLRGMPAGLIGKPQKPLH
ncbi:unnamed protein product [Miscanthus lutarioriparius]|uniref:Uncharacterized protein n=1 Tax=Miscanthus lutarioriparius TaxID=422564 RepID=A0A811PA92_9POAL|nr:unnamed protein product [Miscanthus lutarioriparius]